MGIVVNGRYTVSIVGKAWERGRQPIIIYMDGPDADAVVVAVSLLLRDEYVVDDVLDVN
jgi:hypothetical protein